ncbi:MAG: HigA family addiction module antidote protein [Nitrospinae bacterium]|nr:HigA family addiction module antidote protein [Nitrospinota bacterium]
MAKTIFPPVSPGEILREEFMEPLGLSQNALARALGVPPGRINEILLGKRAVSADTALRLARYFRTTPGFWLNLQNHYDRLADETNLNRESLYRMLSMKGNPSLTSLAALLESLGMKLAVQLEKPARRKHGVRKRRTPASPQGARAAGVER